jgi:hypothetical protein
MDYNLKSQEDTIKFLDRMIVDVYNDLNIANYPNIDDSVVNIIKNEIYQRFSDSFHQELMNYFSDYGIIQYTRRRILERFNMVQNSINQAKMLNAICNFGQ